MSEEQTIRQWALEFAMRQYPHDRMEQIIAVADAMVGYVMRPRTQVPAKEE